MRKQLLAGGFALSAFLIALFSFGQSPSPTERPTASPTPILVSTSTPTPTPTLTATISPNESGTVSVPSTLGASPGISPSPSATPISVQAAALGESDLGWSERGAPVFRIDQAVILALQQNPDVRRTLEEIRRTKGVVIEIRAQALPHIGPSSSFQWRDPNLTNETNPFSTFSSGPTPTPAGTPFPM